jgi:hypothetical protein
VRLRKKVTWKPSGLPSAVVSHPGHVPPLGAKIRMGAEVAREASAAARRDGRERRRRSHGQAGEQQHQ